MVKQEKTKSKRTIYSAILIAIVIISATIFTYVAGLLPKGVKGYFGFSSLRVTFNQISFLTFALLASIRLFIVEKGKLFRFVYLVPITVISYDMIVNVLDARKTYYNEFTPKLAITLSIVIGIIIYYFISKSKNNG